MPVFYNSPRVRRGRPRAWLAFDCFAPERLHAAIRDEAERLCRRRGRGTFRFRNPFSERLILLLHRDDHGALLVFAQGLDHKLNLGQNR